MDLKIHLPLNTETAIVRYMDLLKFFELVQNRRLFMSNLLQMTDGNEGEMPYANFLDYQLNLMSFGLAEKEAKEKAEKERENIRGYKERTLINCWSRDIEAENYALWKIYLGNQPVGVAVHTNLYNFQNAIKDNGMTGILNVAEVNYVQNEKIELKQEVVYTTKTKPYKFEQECRFYMLNQVVAGVRNEKGKPLALYPNGLNITIDVETLINEIVISPFIPKHFKITVENVILSIAPFLKGKIRHSEILDN